MYGKWAQLCQHGVNGRRSYVVLRQYCTDIATPKGAPLAAATRGLARLQNQLHDRYQKSV